jgi:hypothetical protein
MNTPIEPLDAPLFQAMVDVLGVFDACREHMENKKLTPTAEDLVAPTEVVIYRASVLGLGVANA